MNAMLRKWIGIDGEDPVGRMHFDTVLAPMPALASFCREALATDPPHHYETDLALEVNRPARTFHAAAEPMQQHLGGKPYWLVHLEDRTQETEYRDSRAWFLMAQRVAHDIRSPLTGILLTQQRLQMEYRKQAPQVADALDPYSARIEEGIEHLRRMARNFMKFVDLEEPVLALTDLSAFVREQSESIRRSLPPDIHLVLKVEEKLPFVKIDHEQVQSAIENLVSNAVNAMPEGGSITIATQLARALQFPSDSGPCDYVTLEVMDTGVGFPEPVRQRLFEPGFTTSEEGSGLGLAFVDKIVTVHGGHIVVESEPGTGSAFSIYLPAIS